MNTLIITSLLYEAIKNKYSLTNSKKPFQTAALLKIEDTVKTFNYSEYNQLTSCFLV